MKVFIFAAATILIFMGFTVFQIDQNQYLQASALVKATANDCSDAAALYYDQEQYADGHKIFDKDQGNAAILHLLKTNLHLTAEMTFQRKMFQDTCHYTTYYFDGDGVMSTYMDGKFVSDRVITFPYLFEEVETEYQALISEAMVVVTINAGIADYKLKFITDPQLVRTSAHEYVSQ